MNPWKSLAGLVRVSLTSADLYGSLNQINAAKIQIYDSYPVDELTLRFTIDRHNYRTLLALVNKRGEKLRILNRKGLYWSVKRSLQRPVLLTGIALLTALILFLPTRVFFVRVEGNSSIPARLILDKAADCGISFGASRREVRSEKMKNALLEAIPQLQWAGINTSGCVATITVEERTIPQTTSESAYPVSSIIAARDGIIRSCTVIRGNPLCKVGQAVKAGQTLVSGYTDCGLSIQATRADAEIYAETSRELTAVTPDTWQCRGQVLSETKKYSLIIGKKRINLYLSRGLSDSSCVKIYKQYQLTLPGGMELPVALVSEQWIEYADSEQQISEDAALGILDRFSQAYLKTQMVAGQIIDIRQQVLHSPGIYTLTGQYSCVEMIGRVHNEEILKNYGKTD